MAHSSDLYAQWAHEVKRSGFFLPGERVGVAVSGGPDSVLLLEFLRRLARERGLVLAVVHFNHHLRAGEADADEWFVRGLAEDAGLEWVRGEADVARVAREKRRNLEATARELRYQFFFSLINQGRLNTIATAHTASDQAETVLLKLLRGAGTRGLGGISPVLEGKIIRPFLGLTRREVEEEVARRGLKFRTDSSNLETALRRNKIRRELIPWLEREVNPEIVRALKALADRARDDEAVLEQQARESARSWRAREGGVERIAIRPLVEFPRAIARRVLRQMFQAATGARSGLRHAHLEALVRFAAEAQSGRTLFLPGGIVASKEFGWLRLAPGGVISRDGGFSYRVPVPGQVVVPELNSTFDFKIVSSQDRGTSYNLTEGAGLDLLKLSGRLTLRNWQAGDRFRPSGSRKTLKLKELFSRRKIPRSERKLWPVLESGGEVVWARGFPPAATAAATPSSREILMITERVPVSP